MSEPEKPSTVIDLLSAVYRRTNGELRGEHGNPMRTRFVRVVVVLVVLGLCGPLLWAALGSMPTALAVFIGLAIVGRIGRWYWRRGR